MIASINDIESIRPISANLPLDRIVSYIQEAENMRVIPIIGYMHYKRFDEYSNRGPGSGIIDNDKIEVALNGGPYLDKCKREQICYGLKKAIAYIAYAKFIVQNPINVTAFGVVTKSTDLSTPTDAHTINMASSSALKTGEFYLLSVKNYMCLIDIFNDKQKPSHVHPMTSRFKIIGN